MATELVEIARFDWPREAFGPSGTMPVGFTWRWLP